MTAQQIFYALQDFEGETRASQDAAKAGFLEWAMTLPKGTKATVAAKSALWELSRKRTETSAARLFKSYLDEASRELPRATRRGGATGRRKLLH